MSDLKEIYGKYNTTNDIEKINEISTEELIETFDGGVQKSKMKIVFLILIIISLFIVMFF